MLVSCSYCAGQHKRGTACKFRPKRKKEANEITKFRSSRLWKKKSNEIKKRDLFLCQICLLEKRYNFTMLEVHHIYPIANNWNERLKNTNLITLCKPCHIMAENGEFDRKKLIELSENNEANYYTG